MFIVVARKDKGIAALNAIKNITAVKLDVTKQDEVDAAVAMVRKPGTGLYALVNNAGIGGGPVLDTSIEDQSSRYRVNVEGVYRVTQAFVPLVSESKGCISTTGSIAGTITNSRLNAYSGSKQWLEAFTDGLADEMKALDVQVSVIQPGNYPSHIRRSTVQPSLLILKPLAARLPKRCARCTKKPSQESFLSNTLMKCQPHIGTHYLMISHYVAMGSRPTKMSRP
jgi:NADP-dependent 3-hydroxy acid dehydrogenase YdfG